MKKGSNKNLDVDKVIKDFEEQESSSSTHRNGTFKIDKPFDEALNTILKAEPEPKKTKEK
jgi:hypothetical protein